MIASPAVLGRALLSIGLGALAGCGSPPAPNAPTAPAPSAGSPTPAAAAAPSAAAPVATAPGPASPVAAGRPCGDLECRAFDSPRLAFEQAIAGSPRVIAVGEAHAQKAAPGVESATKRFGRDLLPALAPRVKGMVIELLAPDRRCEKHEEQAVAERTKPVTASQRETNQSEFVALGFEAKKLGIQAEPLIPTCDELAHVLATENDVGALLELIASITVREATEFLDHRPADAALAIYGGLVHNDATPGAERASFSFGPRLREHTHESYVEIDLIVPELVKNEPPWTGLAWFSHYDPARSANETLLLRTGPRSFVLIFPRGEASPKP